MVLSEGSWWCSFILCVPFIWVLMMLEFNTVGVVVVGLGWGAGVGVCLVGWVECLSHDFN